MYSGKFHYSYWHSLVSEYLSYSLRGILHNGHILTALPAKRANIESRANYRERRPDDRR